MTKQKATEICPPNLHNLSDITNLEIWSLLKAFNFRRRLGLYLAVNFSQFELLAQWQLPIPYHPAPWKVAVYLFSEQPIHSLQEQEWVKKTLSSKYRICALIDPIIEGNNGEVKDAP